MSMTYDLPEVKLKMRFAGCEHTTEVTLRADEEIETAAFCGEGGCFHMTKAWMSVEILPDRAGEDNSG